MTPEEKSKEVHIARVIGYDSKRYWALFDKHNIMKFQVSTSKNQAIRQWQQKHGKFGTLISYRGAFKPSEFVTAVTNIQMPVKTSESS